MKKLPLYIMSALAVLMLASCSPRTETQSTVSNVSVDREILREEDSRHITWSMTLSSSGVDFHRSSGSIYSTPVIDVRPLNFHNESEARKVIDTFLQWDAVARSNGVEPFTKKITRDCEFDFGSGASRLRYTWSVDRKIYEFDQEDIAKFSDLLKQLPQASAELAAKVEKAKKEVAIFK